MNESVEPKKDKNDIIGSFIFCGRSFFILEGVNIETDVINLETALNETNAQINVAGIDEKVKKEYENGSKILRDLIESSKNK